jgi:pectate lyase
MRNSLFIVLVIWATTALAIPAFPGAVGGGAAATGGRGGAVIQVTNLNDSGTGSLRACMTASGDRTCVFTVGGTINLLSEIYVNSSGGLTVAGQTAPGGGIMLNGKNLAPASSSMIALANPNMIIRYLRVRKGYNSGCLPSAQCGSGVSLAIRVQNTIIDHVSVSWTQDDGMSAWSAVNSITFSNNIIAEGLYSHATGAITGSSNTTTAAGMTNIDFYRNYISNGTHRAPFLGHASGREVNDIVYNTKVHSNQLYGCIQYDGISNIRKRGPYSATTYYEYEGLTFSSGTDACLGSPSMYLSGNIGWNQTNPAGDQWAMAREVSSYNGLPTGTIPTGWRRVTSLANTTYPITAMAVTSLEASLLPDVGASKRLDCLGNWVDARDAVDTRLINQYQTLTGNSTDITNESQVGGFPTIAAGTACSDKDKDGMPDAWEEARGYNPNSPANRNTVAANGYTYLENYLNGE